MNISTTKGLVLVAITAGLVAFFAMQQATNIEPERVERPIVSGGVEIEEAESFTSDENEYFTINLPLGWQLSPKKAEGVLYDDYFSYTSIGGEEIEIYVNIGPVGGPPGDGLDIFSVVNNQIVFNNDFEFCVPESERDARCRFGDGILSSLVLSSTDEIVGNDYLFIVHGPDETIEAVLGFQEIISGIDFKVVDTSDWVEYRNTAANFEISIPPDWGEISTYDGSWSTLGSDREYLVIIGDRNRVNTVALAIKVDSENFGSIDDYVDIVFADDGHLTVVRREELSLESGRGERVVVRDSSDEIMNVYIWKNGNVMVVINDPAIEMDPDSQDLIDIIASTFRFIGGEPSD